MFCECWESPETCRTACLLFPWPSLLLTVPSNLAESIAFAYEEASGEVLLNLGGQHHQCHEAELLLTEGVITYVNSLLLVYKNGFSRLGKMTRGLS